MPFAPKTMTPVALAVLFSWVSPAMGGKQRAYWRDSAPTPTQSPAADPWSAGNPAGWRDITNGNTSDPMGNPVSVPAGGSIYLGAMNDSDPNKRKSVQFKLNWLLGSKGDFEIVGATGVYAGAATPGYVSSGTNLGNIWAGFGPPCPEWEYIQIRNKSGSPKSIRISAIIKPRQCTAVATSLSTGSGPDDTISLDDGVFGVLGEMADPMSISEIQIFPEFVEMDLVAPTPFIADPGTGNWTVDPVFSDPEGRPRPNGGLRYASDGPGLTVDDPYSLSFRMLERADSLYTMYTWDADTAEYHVFRIDLNQLPWGEHFDLYDDGDGLHGTAGWNGWDADPAFDAPVSGERAQSPGNSLKVEGGADIVRAFEGADSGLWSFEAWQYIPFDFVGGDGGPGGLDGSFFNLLNTYSAGGPYEWSVQMQFDSNDGLLKVFNGNGLSTVDSPYDTDRWVRIQTVVDLDDDWTRVYYDDSLVTEYQWTGGVLGTGGGALDIAVVDLYANGSSPVYYDDLTLVPIVPCSDADITTQGAAQGRAGFGVPDGKVSAADLNLFVNSWTSNDTSVADVTTQGAGESDPNFGIPDGLVSAADLNWFVNEWISGCP